ncbi:hypothetical protein OK351_09460 [Glutamicibacter sp. MNS18]|uniref:peptidyl-tRNA hydrolase n=1 Tax=Glutamicibacter sp. MNS18 TaxID=2989817 RepID=UPI00223635A2|nr:peptidyl-tRNA hydrolase [Glutamicibacter sp. MNS18]MCW4465733.1 hypothetical protein [Glutamicibacter sp. MNS18]
MSEFTESESAAEAKSEPGELVQPIILRIDKEDPCGQDEGIAAAALASVAAFLQNPENPAWGPWAAGAFAKSVRRANPKMFAKVLEEFEEHALIEVGAAQAAGLVPLPANALPKRLAKLQVSGTELPESGQVFTGQVQVVLDGSLGMSTGKACAQAAHALFAWLIQAAPETVQDWIEEGATLGIRHMDRQGFERGIQDAVGPVIRDAGRTEIEPGSATAYVVYTG